MLWLKSLLSPSAQPLDKGEKLPWWGKIIMATYLLGWFSLGVALYAYWGEWSAPLKYSLAAVEALLAPDLAGLTRAFGKAEN